MSSYRRAAILRRICALLLYITYIAPTDAFTILPATATSSRRTADDTTISSSSDPQQQQQQDQQPNAVRAPLKYVGPYPCLALRFPHLATSSQRGRNVTGISLDFVLDTAANTNTLNGQVAQELQLEVVGEALPGVGAAGSIAGGDTYLLGDCQLDYGVTMEGTSSSSANMADNDDGKKDKKDATVDVG